MTGSRTASIVFRDFLFLLVLGFVAMVVWLIPWVNPPGDESEDAKPVGNIVVSTSWRAGDIDIDTWVYGPGETKPVGYSRRAGHVFSLLKDDLGSPDVDLNYESVISRGIPAGRYWVNLHAYRSPAAFPITVKVIVEAHTGEPGKGMKRIATTEVELRRKGDERTALSFELTSDGVLVPGSVNNVFRPLRAASGWGN